MSSPPDSFYDVEDAASKKRGRAQSVEPTLAPKNETDSEKAPVVSAPKKTKRVEEGHQSNNNKSDGSKGNSVSTIRKNMKDMSTADNSRDHLDDAMTEYSQDSNYIGDDDTVHTMGTINEECTDLPNTNKGSDSGSPSSDTNSSTSHLDTTTSTTTHSLESNKATHALSRFGSKPNGDSDDWGAFEDDDEKTTGNNDTNETTTTDAGNDKPKYTFGWGSVHQNAPNIQKTTPFAAVSAPGFGSSSVPAATSGFGAFATTTQSSTPKSTASAFGTFASAPTSSPFAMAAATSNTTNALSALPKISSTSAVASLSPGDSTNGVSNSDRFEGQDNENNEQNENNEEHTFGEGCKMKIPGVKPMEVKTGEEDENTVYQTKAKLLILDSTTSNWKERGAGTLRINVKEMESTEGKGSSQTRLVMRTDSVYRLILNLLLFSEMKAFIMQDRFVRFAGFESETKEDGSVDTKLVNYALKVTNPFAAQELHYQISSRIPSKSN
ncbi:hypothetical protein BCR42DRAFT_427822 [Absidia repens]|uniref:RanBD1 domain-containing protein n=1 Tax=Absidia repens TaxID=90262 RepID=A0A1X2HZ79_9FUNG|nr:hypothetical protein BCR42DRAFT_427822 [Absidia repens]